MIRDTVQKARVHPRSRRPAQSPSYPGHEREPGGAPSAVCLWESDSWPIPLCSPPFKRGASASAAEPGGPAARDPQ